jgi:hypothetical protein
MDLHENNSGRSFYDTIVFIQLEKVLYLLDLKGKKLLLADLLLRRVTPVDANMNGLALYILS